MLFCVLEYLVFCNLTQLEEINRSDPFLNETILSGWNLDDACVHDSFISPVVENDDLILRFLHASALQTFAGRLAGTAEQLSRLSLCLFVSLPPSLSLMCRLSQAGVGQAAMSISSIHQAVGRVAERGWRAAEKGQMFCRNWYVFTSMRDVITRRTEKHVAD